jgi:hypothetical protein
MAQELGLADGLTLQRQPVNFSAASRADLRKAAEFIILFR